MTHVQKPHVNVNENNLLKKDLKVGKIISCLLSYYIVLLLKEKETIINSQSKP